MAVAAFRTTNPLLLVLIAAVAAFVVSARRPTAPWSRSLGVFVRLGVIVIVVRVAVEIVFGDRLPGHVLFTLPHVPLPAWAAGVSVGGPVTVEEVLEAAVDGLRLAVVLVCFGAANSLASPYRLLRCLPTVLYEAGVAVTVAPLTSTVLGAVPAEHAGIASAVNNDVARAAGLIAVALLPAAGGITAEAYRHATEFAAGFHRASLLAGVLCAAGGVLAAITIRNPAQPRLAGAGEECLVHCALDGPPQRATTGDRA